jgi:hypothetical protein
MAKEPKSFQDRFKITVEIVAVIAAGLFFVYRFSTGWMSANMDVAIESSRAHMSEAEDYLAITVKLDRGEYGTLQLGQAQVRITFLDSTAKPVLIDLLGTQRLSDVDGTLHWELVAQDDPLLNLHAKEKSQFAAILKVPRNAACVIETAFLTHRRLDGLEWLPQKHWGERRSSSISLPLNDT